MTRNVNVMNLVKVSAVAVTAALGALSYIMYKAAQAAQVQEDAENSLAYALFKKGEYTQEAYQNMLDYASAQQQVTGTGDEVFISQMALLENFGAVGELLPQLTSSVLDMSAALKIDFTAAATTMGKVLGGNVGVISRYGVVLDAARVKTEGATYVLEALNEQFGGAAQARMNTFSGQIALMKANFGDLLEKIGDTIIHNETLLTIIADVSKGFNLWGENIEYNSIRASFTLDDFIVGAVDGFGYFLEALSTTTLALGNFSAGANASFNAVNTIIKGGVYVINFAEKAFGIALHGISIGFYKLAAAVGRAELKITYAIQNIIDRLPDIAGEFGLSVSGTIAGIEDNIREAEAWIAALDGSISELRASMRSGGPEYLAITERIENVTDAGTLAISMTEDWASSMEDLRERVGSYSDRLAETIGAHRDFGDSYNGITGAADDASDALDEASEKMSAAEKAAARAAEQANNLWAQLQRMERVPTAYLEGMIEAETQRLELTAHVFEEIERMRLGEYHYARSLLHRELDDLRAAGIESVIIEEYYIGRKLELDEQYGRDRLTGTMGIAEQIADSELDIFKSVEDMKIKIASSASETMGDFFYDTMTGRFNSIEDYADRVFDSIAKMAADSLAGKLFGGGGSSGFGDLGGIVSSIFNVGGRSAPISQIAPISKVAAGTGTARRAPTETGAHVTVSVDNITITGAKAQQFKGLTEKQVAAIAIGAVADNLNRGGGLKGQVRKAVY